MGIKPRILLLAETPHWALHTIAKAIAQHLGHLYQFEILFSADNTVFDADAYDIIHILFWETTYYRAFLTAKPRIVKSVYSHRFAHRGLSAMDLYHTYLREAHAITVPSHRLFSAIQEVPPQVYLFPEGVDTSVFHMGSNTTSQDLVVGWAGNPHDPLKRLSMLKEACDGICTLRIAGGNYNEQEMVHFYQDIDVIACSSSSEGCPRPLLEGMACGAYPVSFPVGIADEVITSKNMGMLVQEDTVAALRNAILWCKHHPAILRNARAINRQFIQQHRTWSTVMLPLKRMYNALLEPLHR